MSQPCRKQMDRIAELVTGVLPEREREPLERHLSGCPACRRFREALVADGRQLGGFARSMFPSVSRVEERVIGSITTEPVAAHAAAAHVPPQAATITQWRRIMSSNTFKLSAAAAVVAAVVLGLTLLDTGGTGGVAWAAVLANVEKVETFVCRATRTGMDRPDIEMVQYHSIELGIRQDAFKDGELLATTFIPAGEHTLVTLVPGQKGYVQMELNEEEMAQAARWADPREYVRRFTEFEHTSLGTQVIDGVAAEGIEVNDPDFAAGQYESATGRIWVDTRVNLPVRIELDGVSAGGELKETIVIEDFQWNAELAPDVFDATIPDGYQKMMDIGAAAGDETSAIEGLRAYARFVEDRYPSRLALNTAMKEADDHAATHPPADGRTKEEAVRDLLAIRNTCAFYARLVREDRDPAYHGDLVGPEDAHRVLLRWRLDDGNYRVIYGDLGSETVTPELLEALETAE